MSRFSFERQNSRADSREFSLLHLSAESEELSFEVILESVLFLKVLEVILKLFISECGISGNLPCGRTFTYVVDDVVAVIGLNELNVAFLTSFVVDPSVELFYGSTLERVLDT